jgi:hypothetical protein
MRSVSYNVDTEAFSATQLGSAGVILALPAPARLRKLELSYAATLGSGVHLVVRVAQKNGDSWQAGVPLFAAPPFAAPGPMFDPVLAGMTVSDPGGDRHIAYLPSVLGQAWLIQLANGSSATELSDFASRPTILSVKLDAAPRNLTVVLAADSGDVKLWNNPEALIDPSPQTVSFTALAQKALEDTLADKPAVAQVTLPVRLRFDSDSAGKLEITARSLTATYLARPLTAAVAKLQLVGSPVPLALQAPAARMPQQSTLRLRVRHLGRELNDAAPEPPDATPSAGLRADLTRRIASAVPLAPRPGESTGSVLQLVSARLYLAAEASAEAVLELRADCAGAPGTLAAPPIVRQLAAGFVGFCEFATAAPVAAVSGQAPLWLVLRLNKGEVRWFQSAGPAQTSLSSADAGETWGAPDPRLIAAGPLLAQLFQLAPDVPATPVLRLQRSGALPLSTLPLTAAGASGREWTSVGSLPAALHALLGTSTSGSTSTSGASGSGTAANGSSGTGSTGRATTTVQLFSRAALELDIEELVLRYDPFGTSTPSPASPIGV